MSLFGALSELVGGAVLAAAPACDLALPQGALRDPGRFVGWLSVRQEVRELRQVVDALGLEIWMSAETRGLAQRDLEHHATATASAICEFPPSAAVLADLASAMRAAVADPGALSEPIAARIAGDVTAALRASGRLASLGLIEGVVQLLLDRAFAHLTGGTRPLLRLGPALAEFAGEWQPAVSAPVPAGIAVLGISKPFSQQIECAGGVGFLADLGERYGLAERAVRRIVALIDGQTSPAEERIRRLEQLTQWLGEVRAQLLRPSNDDGEVRRRKVAAATALAEGDFETAMDSLRQVRRELREARRRTEERLQEDAIALKTQMLEEARATARLAELSAARGDHLPAAELFHEAAMALPRADRDAAWRFNLQRAGCLLQHARHNGDAAPLAEALAAYGQLVRMAAETTNTRALAEACLGHGDALMAAGERETGTGRLKDAVTIYQKAIQLIERERDSQLLVRARLALTRALARLGERDRSSDVLRKAAQAYRDALALVPADRQPAEHASIRMGLGSMLVLLAIEQKDGGVGLLAEAADAYRAALEILDQETDSERWGEAQFNLGLALLGLGEQDGSSTHYEAAVTAFEAALEATPRVRAPQRWALAQMNLANGLAALGDRDTSSTARLEQAIGAYTAALEELDRGVEPMKWAITQMNLGSTLIRLGERKDKRRHWLAAASALVPALEVFEAERADGFADATRRSLKRFQDSWDSFIGKPVGDTGGADKALVSEPLRIAKAM